MAKVMRQPPSHQFVINSTHPTGHNCLLCTTFYPPEVVTRRLTFWGARHRARFLNSWSLKTGWYYAETRTKTNLSVRAPR